ncbi:MAG: DUF5009 domain-containing protein [Fimbriimonadaceae bacterium]
MEAAKTTDRDVSLDVLRALAILGMMLSGVVPWGQLPGWMYHAQLPPPTHKFNPELPGITWVDLVFPFFILAMGAAIPLAMRKEADSPPLRVFGNIARRGVLLLAFAVLGQHLRPYQMAPSPQILQWLLGLAGFVGFLGVYGRLPRGWPAWAAAATRTVGLLILLGIVLNVRYPNDSGFDWKRVDIIIAVLANMSVLGGIVWWFTRDPATATQRRLLVVGAVAALMLGKTVPGQPLHTFWTWSAWMPLSGPDFLPYLLVVVPGLILGDLLLGARETEAEGMSPGPACAVAFLLVPAVVGFFYARHNIWLLFPFGVLGAWLAARVADPRIRPILLWGYAWLLLGCLLEPYGGGIKKDPKTMGYLLVTPGLGMLTLAGLIALEPHARRVLGFFAAVGQNPLLAYAAITNLVAPLWALTIGGKIAEMTPGPTLGTVRALIQTALLALFVWGFTRLKISMRA